MGDLGLRGLAAIPAVRRLIELALDEDLGRGDITSSVTVGSEGRTVTADMKTSTGGDDAIVVGPRSRIGVGAEWRLLPFLPLRAGVASVTDGWQAGAGVGLRLLGYEMGLSTSIRRRGTANESGVMFGLVGIGR